MKVLIIGAGFSGLCAAIKLTEAGIPFAVFEKASEVGGTWWHNTVRASLYPSSFCRVMRSCSTLDAPVTSNRISTASPSLLIPIGRDRYEGATAAFYVKYLHQYPTQPEILEYLRQTAKKYNLYPHIKVLPHKVAYLLGLTF